MLYLHVLLRAAHFLSRAQPRCLKPQSDGEGYLWHLMSDRQVYGTMYQRV